MLQFAHRRNADVPREGIRWKNRLAAARVKERLLWETAEIDDASLRQWHRTPLSELCDHIQSTHHVFLRNRFPHVSSLIAEAVDAHGATRDRLVSLQVSFITWRNEMLTAMADEERTLFPAIKQMAQKSSAPRLNPRMARRAFYKAMYGQQEMLDMLRETRQAVHGFVAPPDASPVHCEMLRVLREINADIRCHMYKESVILFPRAIELANRFVQAMTTASRASPIERDYQCSLRQPTRWASRRSITMRPAQPRIDESLELERWENEGGRCCDVPLTDTRLAITPNGKYPSATLFQKDSRDDHSNHFRFPDSQRHWRSNARIHG